MLNTLCLDFGNTRLKAAVFGEGSLLHQTVLSENPLDEIEKLVSAFEIRKAILSSVVNHDAAIEEFLATNTVFHKVSSSTKKNFTAPVAKPETIGADRLALIAAAVHFFPSKNNLIIGLGSCITYNFVDQQNRFLGGGISPGMDMRFKAMHEFTALLPLENATWNFPLIGYDTKTNLQSGVLQGMICEIEGITEKYANKFSNFNVVLTGGNATYFAGQLKSQIFADHNFLLKGLYALSELNNDLI